ncbi:MAG: hypothetical protein R3D43_09445 [Tepidamorphaceae bacterium]|nr:hypothetical protein [Rhodobiaceae bacterium]MCC0048800.1 hypothetical protein [Rhodobiaceae bacterium]
MTTDAIAGRAAWLYRVLRRVLAACAILLAWVVVMAVLMVVAEPAPAALVFGGRPNLPGNLSEDIRMMRSSRHMMVLTSSEPGYVREIYGAGAWLVLPALRNGCLDLTSYPDR